MMNWLSRMAITLTRASALIVNNMMVVIPLRLSAMNVVIMFALNAFMNAMVVIIISAVNVNAIVIGARKVIVVIAPVILALQAMTANRI